MNIRGRPRRLVNERYSVPPTPFAIIQRYQQPKSFNRDGTQKSEQIILMGLCHLKKGVHQKKKKGNDNKLILSCSPNDVKSKHGRQCYVNHRCWTSAWRIG